jgi:outer membrane protein OmpA-like peptidoglycan-associated protein
MFRNALLAATVLVSTFTFAQASGLSAGYPVERFRLTTDRSAVLDVEFGRVLNHLDFDVGFYVGGANDPLVIYKTSTKERLGSVVTDRVGASIVGAIGLFDWVQIGVEIPVVLFQAGQRDIKNATVTSLPQLSTTGLGDIRFIPKIRLLKSEDFGIDLAILASIYVPSGGGQNYFGDTGVIVTPELALSRAIGGLRLAGNASVSLLRTGQQVVNLGVGNELTWRIGAGYRFFDEAKKEDSGLEIDASLVSSTSLQNLYKTANQQSLELKGQGAWHFNKSVMAFLGAGVGLQPGWGTPDWRAFLGMRFGNFAGPVAAPVRLDTDGDGIYDDTDKCVTVKENFNGIEDADGCPEAAADNDTDKDGIPNSKDKCPTKAEDKDEFEDADGCPDLDDDKDGVLDTKDKARLVPEDRDGFEDEDGVPDPDNDLDGVVDISDECPMVKGVIENRGCPDVDTDKDTVVDRLDNCPKEPGTAKNQGCKEKQLVILSGDKLEILDSVYFKLNKAIIETRSYPLLNNVAQILVGHPEIKMVRVEGHTDSQGDDASNMKLSDNRAKAVVEYLVKKGIARDRLVGTGFGETKPIADNATKPGRAKNRRVEFNLGAGSGVGKSDNGPSGDTLEK